MEHTILFGADAIAGEVRRLASAIDEESTKSLVVVTVLKGAVVFSSDLVRAMDTETELVFVSASSYVDGFTPGTELTVRKDGTLGVEDRHVLIVEDIVDTGRTLQALQETIQEERPASIRTVALVDKTVRRSGSFNPTYTGFHITDEFIYGYGLDWDQRFRDLPFIAIANP
ncbi:MAG: hypoxanthine phosphoribosyltransferase [Actinomycetota bacterium]